MPARHADWKRALERSAWIVCAALAGVSSAFGAQLPDAAAHTLAFTYPSAPEQIEGLRLARTWRFDVDGDTQEWIAGGTSTRVEARAGALVVLTEAKDPHVLGPAQMAPLAEYTFLGLRCRSSARGITQIYSAERDQFGFDERRMLSVPMPGDGEWHTYRLDLRTIRQASGALRRLRLDPINGAAEIGATFEIDWIALYQPTNWVVPELPYWKDEHTLVLGFENLNHQDAAGPIDLWREGQHLGQIGCLDQAGRADVQVDARTFPEHFWIEAWFAGQRIWRGRMVRPRAPPAEMQSADAAPAISIGSGAGELTRGEHARARLAPIASLSLRGPGDEHTYYEFDVAPQGLAHDPSEPRLYQERLDDPLLAELLCTTSVLGTAVRTTIESSAPVRVLRFEGPRLLESRPHTRAVFPGLEYLEEGEESSQAAWTGPKAADRTTPAPCKLTAPMIALEYDRASSPWVAALTWDPAVALPSAEFRSRHSGLSYATVFLPAVPEYVEENTRFATRALPLAALQRLELAEQFVIVPGKLEDVYAEYWTRRLPQPPRLDWAAPDERVSESARAGPGSRAALERILATSMLAYTQSLFRPGQGWKTHIAIGEAYDKRPEIQAAILAESLRSEHPEYTAAIGARPGQQIEDRTGTAATFVDKPARRRATKVLEQLAPDGSVAYAVTPEMARELRKLTARHGSHGTDLGQVGTTSAGLIANEIGPLLEYAACTRDPVFIAASERALARMNSFAVPRGSQTWEIHMQTPDLYAAAQCIHADLWGWRMSGDERYLDEAVRWAKCGLPFVYVWEPPVARRVESVEVQDGDGEGPLNELRDPALFYSDTQRQVVPYASIPAFGTSWYAVTWIGTPVQWCGLAWGNAVRDLDALRPNRDFVRIADGIFRSAANQQCDRGYLAGTLPDSWEVATARSRQPYIIPERILGYAYRVLDVPPTDEIQYVRLDGPRWTHVASRALLSRVEQRGVALEFDARFWRGQRVSLVVGGTGGEPVEVRVNGRALGRGRDPGEEHWVDFEGRRGALLVYWEASGGADRIEIVDG